MGSLGGYGTSSLTTLSTWSLRSKGDHLSGVQGLVRWGMGEDEKNMKGLGKKITEKESEELCNFRRVWQNSIKHTKKEGGVRGKKGK